MRKLMLLAALTTVAVGSMAGSASASGGGGPYLLPQVPIVSPAAERVWDAIFP